MHIFVRSLTAGAWLVAGAAYAAEPLPPIAPRSDEPTRFAPVERPQPNQFQYADPGMRNFPTGTGANFPLPHGPVQGDSFAERFHIKLWNKVGYPGEGIAAPMGIAYNQAFNAHVTNGLQAQMVLYRYDFEQPMIDREPSRLISHGQLRLSKMATVLAASPCPLVVESTGDPDLDAARRAYVIGELSRMLPYDMPSEKVITGYPYARGISGVEAEIIDNNLMNQTETRGMGTMPSTPGKILSPIAPAPPNVNSNNK